MQISLDLLTLDIAATDNGRGISKDSLAQVGTRYFTSKSFLFPCGQRRNRGEFLASLKQVAEVEIECTAGRAKLVTDGPNKIDENDCCHEGTIVKVKGLAARFPARRKHLLGDKRVLGRIVSSSLEHVLELVLPHLDLSVIVRDAAKIGERPILAVPARKSLHARYLCAGTSPLKSSLRICAFSWRGATAAAAFRVDATISDPSLGESERTMAVALYVNCASCRCELWREVSDGVSRLYDQCCKKLYLMIAHTS